MAEETAARRTAMKKMNAKTGPMAPVEPKASVSEPNSIPAPAEGSCLKAKAFAKYGNTRQKRNRHVTHSLCKLRHFIRSFQISGFSVPFCFARS